MIRVKYTSIPDAQIGHKVLSLSKKQVLALGSGGQEIDWLILAQVDQEFKLHKMELGSLERRLVCQLQWSPTGCYLATSHEQLHIWQLQAGTLSLIKSYKKHQLEITALCWSPDDTRLATTALDNKIVIYNLSNDSIQEIDCKQKCVGVSWDPYDKYIACLRFDNTVNFFRYENDGWKLEISTALHTGSKAVLSAQTKREDRKLDWSADCRYLAVPNLEDRNIPTIAILDRNHSFQVVRTLIGPFSSINVVRFSPILFKFNESYCNIFAVGDNDGNVSLWRLSEFNTHDEQPFLLIKGHKQAGEFIEDLSWSSNGTVLMATTSKKYILMINFQEALGQQLNEYDKQLVLKSLYGDLKNSVKQIKYYQPKQSNNIKEFKDLMQIEEIPEVQQINIQIEKREIPKTIQQTQFRQVIQANGKKKLIPIDQTLQSNQSLDQQQQRILEPQLQISQLDILPKAYNYNLDNKQLQLEVKVHQQKIFTQNQHFTLIRCIQGGISLWQDYVDGAVKLIQHNKDFIIVYTDQSLLYIENHKGMRQEIPLLLPFLSHIMLSTNNYILCLNKEGEFKVINILKRTIRFQGSIKEIMNHVYDWLDKKQLLSEEEKQGKKPVDPLLRINLRLDIDNDPIPEFLFKDYCLYTYDKQLNMWLKTKSFDSYQKLDIQNCKKLNFNQFQFPQQNDNSLYERLLQQTTIDEILCEQMHISKLEEQLKQYQFADSVQSYIQILYMYISKLCNIWPNNSEKIISIIETMIENKESNEYKFLSQRTNMEEVKEKIIYILSQFPKVQDIRMRLFPDE